MDCDPTWYPTKKDCDMRCQSCINNKQGCSFRKEKFAIVKWPKVNPSKIGDDLRKADAQRKRDSKTKKKKTNKRRVVTAGEPKDIFEVDDVGLGASLFNTKQAIPVTMQTIPSASITHVDPLRTDALPSHSRSAVAPMMEESTAPTAASILVPFNAYQSRTSGDTSVLIWYAVLVTIDRLVSNSWLPRVALEAHHSEARNARRKETNDAGMVVATVQDRRASREGLLERSDAMIELEREHLGDGQDLEAVASDEHI
jgi:hypothetical protein